MAARTGIESVLRESFDAVLNDAGFSRSRRVWSRPTDGYEQRVGLDSAHGRHMPVFGLFHPAMLHILWPDHALDPAQVSQCFALGTTTSLIRPARVAGFTADEAVGDTREGIVQGLRDDLSAVVRFLDGLPTAGSAVDLMAELIDKPVAASPFVVPAAPGLFRFSVAALATVVHHPAAAGWRIRAEDQWAERTDATARNRLAALAEAAAARS